MNVMQLILEVGMYLSGFGFITSILVAATLLLLAAEERYMAGHDRRLCREKHSDSEYIAEVEKRIAERMRSIQQLLHWTKFTPIPIVVTLVPVLCRIFGFF